MTDREAARIEFERVLAEYLSGYETGVPDMMTPMRYAITNGGKRIRPILSYFGAEFCGKSAQDVQNIALAIEMIQSYSLVHDDLPCMDNDTMRRGKPTVHIAYGENVAVLAGDGLLTMAFEAALDARYCNAYTARAVAYLARAAGADGMIGGQYIDISDHTDRDYGLQDVTAMYRRKTGALLRAALCASAIQCGASETELADLERYASDLGMVFQITDDILDITASAQQLGKDVGRDADLGRRTYAQIVGLDRAREDVRAYADRAIQTIEKYGARAEKLIALCRELTTRAY